MTEAEGVNLQIFRLQEIKKVADLINNLRNDREKTKRAFNTSADKINAYQKEINDFQSQFDSMQQKIPDLNIPSAHYEKQVAIKSSFFEKAASKHQQDKKEKELKEIEKQHIEKAAEKANQQKKSSFLDSAAHLHKVK